MFCLARSEMDCVSQVMAMLTASSVSNLIEQDGVVVDALLGALVQAVVVGLDLLGPAVEPPDVCTKSTWLSFFESTTSIQLSACGSAATASSVRPLVGAGSCAYSQRALYRKFRTVPRLELESGLQQTKSIAHRSV